jgi:hypothetical protein
MGFSLSGGPYQYNRFDLYEKKKLDPVGKEDGDIDNDGDEDSSDDYLKSRRKAIGKAMKSGGDKENEEEKGASGPGKMAKKVRDAGKKSKKRGSELDKEDEKEEEKEEEDTADVSEGYKPLPKEKMARQAHKAYGKEQRAVASGDEKEVNKQMQRRNAMQMPASRKTQLLNKEEVTNEGTVAPGANLAQRKLNKDDNNSKLKVTKAVMEANEQRMAMYSRALGVMGAHYSGPGFGVAAAPLEEKKEPTDERKEAADRADEEKRQKKEGKKGEAHETKELEKIEDKELAKEEVTLTKEDVLQYLIDENFVNNEVSAEAMFNHISDDFLANIEQQMMSEMGPSFPAETKAQATAQTDHRAGKSSAGMKTAKNPGPKMAKTSGYNKTA